jgi:hypothetical protein
MLLLLPLLLQMLMLDRHLSRLLLPLLPLLLLLPVTAIYFCCCHSPADESWRLAVFVLHAPVLLLLHSLLQGYKDRIAHKRKLKIRD